MTGDHRTVNEKTGSNEQRFKMGGRKKKSRAFRLIGSLVLVGVLAFAGLVGFVCIREGKVATAVAEEMQYDAVIVLGAQVKPDGTPSVQLTWRLDAAAEAYGKAKQPVPVVVCGAQGSDEPCPESVVMKQYLVKQGVPENMILEDPDSRNTKQNLENARKLLVKEYPDTRRVLIVTSDYHVPRAMAIARDLGFEAEGLGSRCLPEYWLKNHAREALAWVKYWAQKLFH